MCVCVLLLASSPRISSGPVRITSWLTGRPWPQPLVEGSVQDGCDFAIAVLDTFNYSGKEERRSRLEYGKVGFEFLYGQSESKISAYAFAFHKLTGVFRHSHSEDMRVLTLVTVRKTRSLLDEPRLPIKRKKSVDSSKL